MKEHPNVQFIPLDQAEQADYIIELPIVKVLSCSGPYPNRTLVLDESDEPVELKNAARYFGPDPPHPHYNALKQPLFLAAFKRSFVWKDASNYVKRHFQGMQYPGTPWECYFPIQYTTRSNFIPEKYPRWEDRQFNVSNVLREEAWDRDGAQEGARTATRVSETHA